VVLEVVAIEIDPARAEEFEAAVVQAKPLFLGSPGCASFDLSRSLEHPAHYRLLVNWHRIEDHLEGFRNSDAFPKWRALVTPFLAAPLSMQHFEPVTLP
jgi:quinol monooxygenase YgiN